MRGVKRRAAPHLQAEKVGQSLRHGVARWRACRNVRTRVASNDWCASRNVVSVSSSRFSLRAHCGEFLRAPASAEAGEFRRGQQCPVAVGIGGFSNKLRDPFPLHFGIAVENHVADVGEQLRSAVGAAVKPKKFRRLVEKCGGHFARPGNADD